MANCSKQGGKEAKPQVVTKGVRKYGEAEGKGGWELGH